MAGFTKLFNSIITSTVWQEDAETKVVWITLMALADANGETDTTIPGLARLSGVSIKKCEAALLKFQEPDPYSRSQEFEGRRIIKTTNGWRLLNYTKYREMRDIAVRQEQNRLAQKRFRDKQR